MAAITTNPTVTAVAILLKAVAMKIVKGIDSWRDHAPAVPDRKPVTAFTE
ncbi:hypothetical protein [Rhizobium leguminosarum]|nr:hypothetical protein [Rhizobium leguminosarum]